MTSIFVAKLDFAVDNQQLQSLFEEYGKVNKATVALDRETGKSRGFGFVEMFDDAEAQSAIEALDGHEVNGRSLAVKEAEDRGGSKPAPRRDAPRPVNRDASPSSSSSSEAPSYNSSSSSEDAPAKDFSRKKANKPKTRSFDTPDEGRGKQTKLNPYKKSGKDSIHIEDDDDFEDIDLFGRNEDDDDDEDYSKYLVNADDDDDEDDFDENDSDDEEYDDED